MIHLDLRIFFKLFGFLFRTPQNWGSMTGRPQETYNRGGRWRGSKHILHGRAGEREKAKRKLPYTFKLPDLMRTHHHENSKGDICLHDPVTSHQAPSPTLGVTIRREIWAGTQIQTISDALCTWQPGAWEDETALPGQALGLITKLRASASGKFFFPWKEVAVHHY